MNLRKLVTGLVAAAGLAFASIGTASAALVNITYTADNLIFFGGIIDDSSSTVVQPFPAKLDIWTNPATQVVDLAPGNYTIFFVVGNSGLGSPSNPAALLAEITGPVTGDLVTSNKWEFSSNFGSSWVPATSYGNNGGSNIWTNSNSGNAVFGISTTAQWIWASTNGSANAPQGGFLRGSFTVVPVPAAVWLLGSALMGMGFVSRRRKVS